MMLSIVCVPHHRDRAPQQIAICFLFFKQFALQHKKSTNLYALGQALVLTHQLRDFFNCLLI
jgi:hypothetical protein